MMWCNNAVNRIFLSRRAACRTLISPIVALFRLWVRSTAVSRVFPLVEPLPSTNSADFSSLFARFIGTMGPDSPAPYLLGLTDLPSPAGPLAFCVADDFATPLAPQKQHLESVEAQ